MPRTKPKKKMKLASSHVGAAPIAQAKRVKSKAWRMMAGQPGIWPRSQDWIAPRKISSSGKASARKPRETAAAQRRRMVERDRRSVVQGQSVAVLGDIGGRRSINIRISKIASKNTTDR